MTCSETRSRKCEAGEASRTWRPFAISSNFLFITSTELHEKSSGVDTKEHVHSSEIELKASLKAMKRKQKNSMEQRLQYGRLEWALNENEEVKRDQS